MEFCGYGARNGPEVNKSPGRDLASYLEWTGDVEGVTQDADGSYQAQCLEDRFWIAPACRQNVTSCIATVTFAASLWLSMMHWSLC